MNKKINKLYGVLSVRSINYLLNRGYKTVKEIDINNLNCGIKTKKEIVDYINSLQ